MTRLTHPPTTRQPTRSAPRAVTPLLAFAIAASTALTAGCTSSTRPGDLSRVQVTSDLPRRGNVYLLRGWIGIFSAGIDQMGVDLNDAGIRASVYQEAQWPDLANAILTAYEHPRSPPEPLVLIGHSYGADSVIRIARRLQPAHVHIDLLITLDPVTPPTVPSNVLRTYNLYQSNGVLDTLPFLRGIPLVADADNKNELKNLNIRVDRTDLLTPDLDHFNIEKQPLVHADVLAQVQRTCPWRFRPAAANDPAPPPPPPAPRALSVSHTYVSPDPTPHASLAHAGATS
jgi:surfactin synthase thioesterase subunit